MAESSSSPYEHETSTKRRNSLEFLPPLMTEMRVVLLGNSWSEQSSVGNFIFSKIWFNPQEEPERCVSLSEFIGDKKMVVISTPNFFHPDILESKLNEFVEDLVKLSDPGPHMFLLVLQPESFTEQQQKRLQSALQFYGDQVYNHILVLIPDGSGGLDKPQQHPQYGELMNAKSEMPSSSENLKEDKGVRINWDAVREVDASQYHL
ncbi:GTPase IMAP family member 4-like [Cololabis saira]|uniref:GTPase IMAP family member 4-like n=1 Tax=Cololabis saira TaxID=129043 RepID=UPI002AD5227C|nr:GTPase IMAP family member 4-like [Cololabis saira]